MIRPTTVGQLRRSGDRVDPHLADGVDQICLLGSAAATTISKIDTGARMFLRIVGPRLRNLTPSRCAAAVAMASVQRNWPVVACVARRAVRLRGVPK